MMYVQGGPQKLEIRKRKKGLEHDIHIYANFFICNNIFIGFISKKKHFEFGPLLWVLWFTLYILLGSIISFVISMVVAFGLKSRLMVRWHVIRNYIWIWTSLVNSPKPTPQCSKKPWLIVSIKSANFETNKKILNFLNF